MIGPDLIRACCRLSRAVKVVNNIKNILTILYYLSFYCKKRS